MEFITTARLKATFYLIHMLFLFASPQFISKKS